MHKALGLIPVPHPHNPIHTPKKKKKRKKEKKSSSPSLQNMYVPSAPLFPCTFTHKGQKLRNSYVSNNMQ
jgi:hypothetical protein